MTESLYELKDLATDLHNSHEQLTDAYVNKYDEIINSLKEHIPYRLPEVWVNCFRIGWTGEYFIVDAQVQKHHASKKIIVDRWPKIYKKWVRVSNKKIRQKRRQADKITVHSKTCQVCMNDFLIPAKRPLPSMRTIVHLLLVIGLAWGNYTLWMPELIKYLAEF